MQLDQARVRRYLKAFDFVPLFIEELGWDHHRGSLPVEIKEETFTLKGVAQKRGMVAYMCQCASIPPYRDRRKIERKVARSVHEHLVIYIDGARATQIWQWVKREPGKPAVCREHHYDVGQAGDALIQKLAAIAFSLAEEEGLTIVDVTSRVRAAFDVERVTRRFYDRFKAEQTAFLKFLEGISDAEMLNWYVSVMINRLMFIYFIQKKGFLNDGDLHYLQHKLEENQQHGPDRFYRDFLCPLFFEGFARREHDRSPEARQMLGRIPFLNGGLFLRHEIEQRYDKRIQIPDAAFERLFTFFEQYQWHLDDRPLRADNEINPGVLGYIFEKYINQKQMGAYYTEEDITDYISKNTILPFLFDRLRETYPAAFDGEDVVWDLLQEDPDRYIYPAVRHGVGLDLPPEIAAGLDDVAQRGAWNTPAPEEYGLPTEIWRETVARHKRYEEIWLKLVEGKVRSIHDLITLNLDIRQFAQDVIGNCTDPAFLRAFWRAINEVTVLDPTVGSGAFLFAALNILEPLYEACLDRMAIFVAELPPGSRKLPDFREVLGRVAQHPNQHYFILKSIIINNLYGVDIMDEAVEIAKLRLFLKLVAEVGRVDEVEPLPDIDFNIRAGNTLVGFATYDEVEQAVYQEGAQMKLMMDENPMVAIEEKAQDVDRLYQHFRRQQTELGGEVTPEDKQALRERLDALNDELDRYLAREYGVDADLPMDLELWRQSHKPFHWFVEFYGILKQGGFDMLIGNPPYVQYHKVKKVYQLPPRLYRSEKVGNLYAFCMERSGILLKPQGQFGMIVPAGLLGLDKAASLREVLLEMYQKSLCSTYAIRPSKLFAGVDQRLCVYLACDQGSAHSDFKICTTQYRRWNVEERPSLFPTLVYYQSFNHQHLKRIPQIGSAESASIIAKIEKKSRKPIARYLSPNKTGYLLHYHRSPRYWIRAMDFEQYFKSPTRTRSIHHFRDLHFRNRFEGRIIGAILNSSLFFLWFVSVGNGRNITGTDVEQFPIGELTKDVLAELPEIFGQLMDDYRANSVIRVRQNCEFQEFYPSKSKPIIDEIDRVLAQHYGFTDKELDFIINYDIKYRMGDDLFESEI